jgi:hypothetical protein
LQARSSPARHVGAVVAVSVPALFCGGQEVEPLAPLADPPRVTHAARVGGGVDCRTARAVEAAVERRAAPPRSWRAVRRGLRWWWRRRGPPWRPSVRREAAGHASHHVPPARRRRARLEKARTGPSVCSFKGPEVARGDARTRSAASGPVGRGDLELVVPDKVSVTQCTARRLGRGFCMMVRMVGR